jgi:4-amino-4-deoxy-L-arabinose transferase-like glycosyltransferase
MPDPLLTAAAVLAFAGLWLWACAGSVWEAAHHG